MRVVTVTCDACRKTVHNEVVNLGFNGLSFHFFDLNCLSAWIDTRWQQIQGGREVITAMEKPSKGLGQS